MSVFKKFKGREIQPFGESIVSQREKLIKKQFVTRLSLWSDPQKKSE